MLSFKSLLSADFPLMLEWLQRPHVKEWWHDGEDTLEKVALGYGQVSEDEQVERFVLMMDHDDGRDAQPIGYFQWYLLPDGTAGIDQFIGEAHLLNQGIGTQAIRQFLAMLIERHNPPRIIIDPHPDNKRAIRCYEKVGFQHYKTITTEEGTPAYMMEIRR